MMMPGEIKKIAAAINADMTERMPQNPEDEGLERKYIRQLADLVYFLAADLDTLAETVADRG